VGGVSFMKDNDELKGKAKKIKGKIERGLGEIQEKKIK
jgi:hypothetical protein